MADDQQFTISVFRNKFDATPRLVVRTWRELMCNFQSPLVRKEKDGWLFSPARFVEAPHTHKHRRTAHCPCGKLRGACPPEELYPCEKACRNLDCVADVSLLVLDCDHGASIDSIEATLVKLDCTYAIYSTHSHLRVTESNPNAEPRYRVVIPLAEPISKAEFPKLWQWAKRLDGLTVDESAKDPSRMYYTPAIASPAAKYLWRGNRCHGDFVFLDWKAVLFENSFDSSMSNEYRGDGNSQIRAAGMQSSPQVSTDRGQLPAGDFMWHEDRHDELCNRIMARATKNGRGNWDAKALCHSGRGGTGLCYFPNTGAVKCNKGCSYEAVLAAEGLSTLPLRSKEAAARRERINALREAAQAAPLAKLAPSSRPVTVAYLDAPYSVLLAHLLNVTPHDEELIRQHWNCEAYGTLTVPHPETNEARPIKTCSLPSELEAVIAANKLAEWFTLDGVPGFYYDDGALPGQPTFASQRARWYTANFGPWRIKLPFGNKGGLLVPYGDESGQWIIGIRVYRNIRDRVPTLLTSRGLPGGAKALPVREEVAA